MALTDGQRLQAARAKIRKLVNADNTGGQGDFDDIVRALVGFEVVALVKLLVAKGVITQAEVVAAMADAAEQVVNSRTP